MKKDKNLKIEKDNTRVNQKAEKLSLIEKIKRLSVFNKLLLGTATLIIIIVLIYLLYVLFHYTLYREYKKFLPEAYVYEEGTEFKGISDKNKSVEGMILVAENDYLKLYMNKKTANVAVYDKRSKVTTYANPLDGANDSGATKANKAFLQSQMIVDYYNTSNYVASFNSFDAAVSNDQVKYEALENGFRAIYTFGDFSSKTGIVPDYLSEERYNEIIKAIYDTQGNEPYRLVRDSYKESDEVPGSRKLVDGMYKAPATLRKLNNYFAAIGYTEDDYKRDMEASGVEGAIPYYVTIPLEYRLDGEKLIVSIDPTHIEEGGGAKLAKIELLRYFGCASKQEEGYMLVPNSSGSIINFNNGKTEAEEYGQYVYGIDPLSASYDVKENVDDCRLPVFGFYRQDSKTGIFAEILSGDSDAVIKANISGKVNSYNFAYPSFYLRSYEQLGLSGTIQMTVVEEKMWKKPIIVSYSFLTEENAGYAGMANYYRNELVKRGYFEKIENKEKLPLYLNVIGSAGISEYFLGFKYDSLKAMTTFDDAAEIVNDMYAAGIDNIVMNYQGWFNDGYYHKTADSIDLDNCLGSKRDLAKLAKLLEDKGGKLYGDVAFQKISFAAENGIGGYNYQREDSRYYGSSYVATFGQVSPVTLRQTASLGYRETMYNLVSPKYLVRYVEAFSDKVGKYDITGVSLRDLGSSLTSDKKRREIIEREYAKEIVLAMFEKLQGTGKDLMVTSPNIYSVKYADDIMNLPVYSNEYLIIDMEVPFYQMVLHGMVDYTSTPINLDDSLDETECILKLVEYGSAPSFTITKEASNELKYTGLNSFYSTTYDTWSDFIKRVYGKLDLALSDVTNCNIISHEVLDNELRVVGYDNGTKIIINKTDNDLKYQGKTIKAKDFLVEVGDR
ncbi:MAG: DUF5696 domain-containing protein [Lachnospiraceae bacterium]|nr:DUF5696 domain-containing protein [Lachnospiraceae bacterium]